jgi:hypothetical protein
MELLQGGSLVCNSRQKRWPDLKEKMGGGAEHVLERRGLGQLQGGEEMGD